ncbi:MAG TPA: aspartate kinase [bacterium]|nr:aspartate kinase [bacterium]
MIVMKFGGSSLATAEHLRQVADLCTRAAKTPCVVLSALGATTDRLLHIERLAGSDGHDAATAALEALFLEVRALTSEVLQSPDDCLAGLQRMQQDLALLLRGIAKNGASARATDAVLAHGERIATTLLTALLRQRGADAIEVDARDVLRTDATFGRARPDRGQIRQLAHQCIGPFLGRKTIVVTQGFVGRSADGATTTLGRGGSDWTAALLGAALGADEVQIWTDVEGVLTADPRVVRDAMPIAEMSPEEAAELAAFGARVLHPSTIQPAVDRGIPVTVRHTMRPDGAFTRIDHRPHRPARGIAALAARGPVSVMTMTSRRMLAASGYLAKLFAVFGEHEVPIDLIATAEVSVACTVEADAPIPRLIAALDGLAHVEVHEDCAIVAAIGDGLQRTERALERACRALHPIEPVLVSFGGNSRNLSFVVQRDQQEQALRDLHDEFFGAREASPLAATTSEGQTP